MFRPFYSVFEKVLMSRSIRLGAPTADCISDEELEELGNKMAGAIEQYRGSALHKLRTKGRAALVRAL
jgi:hypothetical protein